MLDRMKELRETYERFGDSERLRDNMSATETKSTKE
jgi:hypothetical protein